VYDVDTSERYFVIPLLGMPHAARRFLDGWFSEGGDVGRILWSPFTLQEDSWF
jgi:hypothetical protein